jgi:L-ascorbate metabolism protein UlaG (beta-lactamase superfamily)
MKIKFVNHASFIIESGEVRLLCDPWTEGLAFNNGWALLSQTPPECIDYNRLTHIWFSHEHPDHFSPGAIKAIPEAARRHITVLFQQTADQRVIDFCRKLNFKALLEMQPDNWIDLDDVTQALCNPQTDEWQGDSWLCVKTDDQCLLNVNDCGIYTQESAQRIAAKTGQVDLLCTQFSYAAWQGNADELAEHKHQAARQLAHVKTQTEAIAPSYVLPFASFVWFCHEENYFLNEGMNSVADAARWIAAETAAEPVVLYPGDEWKLGEDHDWRNAADRYARDSDRIHANPDLISSQPVNPQLLAKNAQKFINFNVEKSSRLLVQMYLAMESFRNRRATAIRPAARDFFDLLRLNIEPAKIYVTDLNQAYLFSLPGGLQTINAPVGECDISMSSESLDHCFLIDWGGETLMINSRFQEPHGSGKPQLDRGEQARRWFKFTDLSRRFNMGFRLDWSAARAALAWRIKNLFGIKQTASSGQV